MVPAGMYLENHDDRPATPVRVLGSGWYGTKELVAIRRRNSLEMEFIERHDFEGERTVVIKNFQPSTQLLCKIEREADARR